MEHNHHEHCGCGHHHEHEHEHCGCGHHHEHEHEHCGCGHHHHHDEPRIVTARAADAEVSGNELAILKTIEHVSCLPVARLIATSSEEDEVVIECMAPVYLYDVSDTMDDVRAIGGVLRGLEEKGLLTLDYDLPIQGFDYSLYTQSDLFAYFTRTIEEAKGREGFLCDTAEIELGSMALTQLGEEVCAREK